MRPASATASSPNDVHRLENMDLIPAEEGGDDYYLNGGYVKLKDAGVAQQNKAAAVSRISRKKHSPTRKKNLTAITG